MSSYYMILWFIFTNCTKTHTRTRTHTIYTLKYLLGGRSIQGQDSCGGESGVMIQDLQLVTENVQKLILVKATEPKPRIYHLKIKS